MDGGDGDEDDEESSICVTFTVCRAVCRALHRTPRSGAVTSPPHRVTDEEVAQVEPVTRAQRACTPRGAPFSCKVRASCKLPTECFLRRLAGVELDT